MSGPVTPVHAGGCMCGAVRFACRGRPINVRVCHCRSCQRAHGAPSNARALFAHAQVTVDGPVGRHRTSPTLERLFCTACGTRLMAWRDPGGVVGVSLAGFDDPHRFTPTAHVWVDERPPWVLIADGLPRFGGPAPD